MKQIDYHFQLENWKLLGLDFYFFIPSKVFFADVQDFCDKRSTL